MQRLSLALFILAIFLVALPMTACSDDDPEPSDGDTTDGDTTDGDDSDGDDPDGDDPTDGDAPPCRDGDSRPDDDDCNTCTCYDGSWACTDMACGDGDEDGDTSDGDDEPDKELSPRCAALEGGWNREFTVDGQAREFLLHLPENVDSGGPWPVVFNWHGLGDTATNMSRLLSGSVGNAVMPFILVTPEDIGFRPMTGLDWAILQVNENNPDARLFDEILVCLDEKWGVDHDRIHSTGFSAGAIMTNVLATIRGDVLASTYTFSGAYFSNPVNAAYVGMVNWPDFTTTNKFAQVMIHGGSTDEFDAGLMRINFNTMGTDDVGWLTGLGHDVIHCDHGGGHTVPGGTYPMPLIRFFADHPRGVADSPYAGGLPDAFPAYCVFMEKN